MTENAMGQEAVAKMALAIAIANQAAIEVLRQRLERAEIDLSKSVLASEQHSEIANFLNGRPDLADLFADAQAVVNLAR